MHTTLLQIWKTEPAFLEGKSFRQIIQMAGDGSLRDGTQASTELREWLAAVPLDRLRSCIEECLANSFDSGPQALQDATNELGVRLGFQVTPGRYRGSKGEIGNDGLWRSPDDFALLIEVKTTDAYRISLDTVARYRDRMITEGTIEQDHSSILIAVGREDTGGLEAQIRGSSHAWDIRLISLEALLRLAEVKEELSDLETGNKINQLLRPVEYTRLDEIVELLFAAKRDLEVSPELEPLGSTDSVVEDRDASPVQLEAARNEAVSRIGNALECVFIKRGRAFRESSDGKKRLVCLVSQAYAAPESAKRYWYGFTPSQRRFLEASAEGWVSFICADSGRTYLVSWEQFSQWLPQLLTSPPTPSSIDDVRHWHVYFLDYGDRVDLAKSGGGIILDLRKYQMENT